MPADLPLTDWVLRLACAAVLSGMVGLERESRNQAAGLRTHMLIGFGAALFTLVGIYGFEAGDASRVAAQIVSGVGFLGAGAIFREGATVRGLTTAAGIWGVAAIGMAAGTGLLWGATVAAAMVILILFGLGFTEEMVKRRRSAGSHRRFVVELADLSELTEVVSLACMLDDGGRQIGVNRQPDSDGFTVEFGLSHDRVATVLAAVSSFPSVRESWEIDPEDG